MKDNEQLERLIEITAISGLGGLLVGVSRIIIHEKYGSLLRFFRGAVSSVVVAVLASYALADSGLSWTRQAAIVGVLAYVADDMLIGLMILGKLFASNPLSFFREVISSIKGGGKST